jgi:hypothetical protein
MRKKGGDVTLRRSTLRLKPKERTYAHNSKLWVARGGAPSRYSMLTVLFSSQSSTKNKISYKKPTMSSSSSSSKDDESGEEEEEEEESDHHTAIFIDECARFYFFPKKEADSFGADSDLTGIFLLRSSRDSEMPPMGESITLYRVFGPDIYDYAPFPTKEQRAEANKMHRVRNDELRLKLADWFGLIRAKREDRNSIQIVFTPENFTRKRTMTTGRIGGIAN